MKGRNPTPCTMPWISMWTRLCMACWRRKVDCTEAAVVRRQLRGGRWAELQKMATSCHDGRRRWGPTIAGSMGGAGMGSYEMVATAASPREVLLARLEDPVTVE